MTLPAALEEGLHGSSLLRFYHLGARLPGQERDLLRRLRPRLRARLQGRRGRARRRRHRGGARVAARPEELPRAHARAARRARAALARRADAALPRDARRAERAPRRRRQLGRHRRPLAVRPRRPHPTGIRVGGPGKSRSAMKVAEERRFKDYRTDVDARRAPDAGRAAPPAPAHAHAARRPSSTSTRPSTRPAATPARSSWSSAPPRRNDVRLLLLMDVGGTMDPYFEPVSQLLTALHEERGLREFQPYYFHNCVYDHVYTQRAHAARRRGADRRHPAPARRALEGASIVGDAAMHPAELLEPLRQHRPAPHLADARHRLAAAHRRPLRPRGVDQPRDAGATGTARTTVRIIRASSRCST